MYLWSIWNMSITKFYIYAQFVLLADAYFFRFCLADAHDTVDLEPSWSRYAYGPSIKYGSS